MSNLKEHTLSIIVCTKDREQGLRNCLDSIFHQTRRPDEIIIVDDGNLPERDIVGLVARHEIACRYLRKDTVGLTASRNLGVQHVKGDVVLFLDDDVLLDPGYVAGIMEIFEGDLERRVGGVTGVLRTSYRPGVLLFLRFFGLDARMPGAVLPSGKGVLVREGDISYPVEVQWLSGCNMSYRREVFDTFSFDKRLGSYGWGEDRDFSYRVSKEHKLVATPAAALVHLENPGGRIHPRRFGFMETNYLYRFFAKNMPKRPMNWLALGWAMLGIVIKNILLAVIVTNRSATLAQLGGNLQGLYAILTRKDAVS